ncbi:hypothetical protein B0H10DRAFT_2229124 [Mycena sp. CBHHK59/15]|nr:hypothetical protein B0H10DRAFT_2229124 [Mycena sp. CBHHK59/15]
MRAREPSPPRHLFLRSHFPSPRADRASFLPLLVARQAPPPCTRLFVHGVSVKQLRLPLRRTDVSRQQLRLSREQLRFGVSPVRASTSIGRFFVRNPRKLSVRILLNYARVFRVDAPLIVGIPSQQLYIHSCIPGIPRKLVVDFSSSAGRASSSSPFRVSSSASAAAYSASCASSSSTADTSRARASSSLLSRQLRDSRQLRRPTVAAPELPRRLGQARQLTAALPPALARRYRPAFAARHPQLYPLHPFVINVRRYILYTHKFLVDDDQQLCGFLGVPGKLVFNYQQLWPALVVVMIVLRQQLRIRSCFFGVAGKLQLRIHCHFLGFPRKLVATLSNYAARASIIVRRFILDTPQLLVDDDQQLCDSR